jgi:uncharacterized protein
MTSEPSGKISFLIPAAFAVIMSVVFARPYLGKLLHFADSAHTAPSAPSPTAGTQPSFSCERAVGAPELAICGDAELASLDAEMGRLYGPLVRTRPELRIEQRAWLRHRNKTCGGDVSCLKSELTSRVDHLRSIGSQ